MNYSEKEKNKYLKLTEVRVFTSIHQEYLKYTKHIKINKYMYVLYECLQLQDRLVTADHGTSTVQTSLIKRKDILLMGSCLPVMVHSV